MGAWGWPLTLTTEYTVLVLTTMVIRRLVVDPVEICFTSSLITMENLDAVSHTVCTEGGRVACFWGVSHGPVPSGGTPASPRIFGTSYMLVFIYLV